MLEKPQQAPPRELERIGWDTVVGMAASNIAAFFIMLTTAVTPHANGHTDIQTSEQAAAALKPIVRRQGPCYGFSVLRNWGFLAHRHREGTDEREVDDGHVAV